MDDLQATRLCAEAMGINVEDVDIDTSYDGKFGPWPALSSGSLYDPLDDDAQAMALVYWLISNGHHVAFETATKGTSRIGVCDSIVDAITDQQSVRRFIVYCVAAMQEAKNG